MKNIALILVTLLFITSCQKRAAPLVFESKSIQTDGLELCKEGICPIIDIEKITASGNETFADTINAAINQVLINNLVIDPDEEPNVETFNQALAHFISSYRIYKSDFPDAGAEYEINSASQVSYDGAQLLSIKFENYTYWGGAHGYGSTTYINFDKDAQTQLSNKELFKDYEGFLKLAETKFRNKKKLSADENINSTGFLFENNVFALPNVIGFTANEMVLVYNPYEIASYVDGQTILKFKFSEVQEYLKLSL